MEKLSNSENIGLLTEQAKAAYISEDFQKAAMLHNKLQKLAKIIPANSKKPLKPSEISKDPLLPVITDLDKTAYSLKLKGNYHSAIKYYNIEMKVAENSLGKNNVLYAQLCNNLGDCLKLKKEYDHAIDFFKQALDILRNPINSEEGLNQLVVQNLLDCFDEKCSKEAPGPEENFSRSISSMKTKSSDYAKPIRIRFQIPGQNLSPSETILTRIANRANSYDSIGDYKKGIFLYEQNLEIAKIIYRTDPIKFSIHVRKLASNYIKLGQLDKAEPILTQSAKQLRTCKNEGLNELMKILYYLASLYSKLGNNDKCIATILEAISHARKIYNLGDSVMVEWRENLAIAYLKASKQKEAELLINELAIVKGLDKNCKNTNDLQKYANFEVALGKYDRAEALYFRAIDILRKEEGHYDLDLAMCLSNLATLYRENTRFSEAALLYEEALKIRKTELGRYHPMVGQTLARLALAYSASKRPKEALTAISEVAFLDSAYIDLAFSITSNREKLLALESVTNNMDVYFSIISTYFIKDADEVSKCFDLIQTRKGVVLQALSNQKRSLISLRNLKAKKIMEELAELKRDIGSKINASRSKVQSAKSFDNLINRAIERRDQLESRLSKIVPPKLLTAEYNLYYSNVITENLSEETVLLEFIRYNQFQFYADISKGDKESESKYFVIVVKKDNGICSKQFIPLGLAEAVDSLVNIAREAIIKKDKNYLKHLQNLSAKLVIPIIGLLGNKKNLIVSPDSSLCSVPFEILLTDSGQHLIDRYEISYVGTSRDILKFNKFAGTSLPPVVIADPDYSYVDENLEKSTNEIDFVFKPLPGSKKEGDYIADLLKVPLVSGEKAVKSIFTELYSPLILHVATHGFFENLGYTSREVMDNNPLLKSGLVLAGANRKSDKNYGILTAEEITSLDLSGTELVVLSACETGIGETTTREGVYGFQYAFILAGAQRLIMSLWTVSDEVVFEEMKLFYKNILDGLRVVEALRLTKLAIREKYRHPIYWGAFILRGNPSEIGNTILSTA